MVRGQLHILRLEVGAGGCIFLCMQWARVLLFVTASVWVAYGQRPDPWQVGKDGVPYTPETGAARAQIDLKADSYVHVASITGHPFSAWIVTTVKQVAEDGTPRTYVARDLVARDAVGRWYCEHRMHPVGGSYAPGLPNAQVWDPVTHIFMDLDMARKTALLAKEEGGYIHRRTGRGGRSSLTNGMGCMRETNRSCWKTLERGPKTGPRNGVSGGRRRLLRR